MAFSSIGNQQLGKFLQIAFSEGIRTQISENFRDWEMVSRERVGNPDGRELRFLFQSSFGPSAVQYRNPNFSTNFPASQQITTAEHTAVYKEIDVTVELPYNLWKGARDSKAKYAEPLAREIQSKTYAAKRRLAADLYGDGTGVVGTLEGTTAVSGGKVVFTLDQTNAARGHVGFFEFGDDLLLKAADSTASALDTDLATEPTTWRVVRKDRQNGTVTLQGLDSNGAAVSVSSVTTGPTAGDVFYRIGQPSIPDLTAAIADYGSITEVIAGLESLVADDGRVVHGITMEGSTAGTRYDAGNVTLDVSHIQAVLDQAKINAGESAYAYKMMCMAPEAHAALIESREGDRRFHTVDDNKRGIRFFAYQHGQDAVETYTSEYVPKKRIYMMPEAKSGQGKVLEYHGTDFEPVSVNDSGEFHLKTGASGHERSVVTFLNAMGVLICKHPQAVAVVENFTTV